MLPLLPPHYVHAAASYAPRDALLFEQRRRCDTPFSRAGLHQHTAARNLTPALFTHVATPRYYCADTRHAARHAVPRGHIVLRDAYKRGAAPSCRTRYEMPCPPNKCRTVSRTGSDTIIDRSTNPKSYVLRAARLPHIHLVRASSRRVRPREKVTHTENTREEW